MIDLQKYAKQYEKNLEKGIGNALVFLKEKVDERTPEDTKTLLKNNTIGPVINTGRIIIGEVYNDTEYALYVERGIGKNFNYNKPKGTIFKTGNGAKMFATTADLDSKKAIEIVKKELIKV